jgi:hypothetical protein
LENSYWLLIGEFFMVFIDGKSLNDAVFLALLAGPRYLIVLTVLGFVAHVFGWPEDGFKRNDV